MKDFLMFHGYSSNTEFGYLCQELSHRGYRVDRVDETNVGTFTYDDRYKYVVVCWHDQLPDYFYVEKTINNLKGYDKLALYDDTDWEHVMGSSVKYDLVFKREYVIGRSYTSMCPIVPMPKTAKIYHPEENKKVWDVCCLLGGSDEHTPNRLKRRAQVIDLLKQKAKTNWLLSYDVPMSHADYRKAIYSSKICINAYGNGWDTIRFWEILSMGSCLLTPKIKTVIDPPFSKGAILECSEDYSDMIQIIEEALTNSSWIEIAKRGRDNFLMYHTIANRADVFIKNMIKGNP